MGMGASGTSDIEWVTQTCKFGWSVEGIYPSGQDCTHVNSVAQCKALSVIATGDDYGLVNLYRDPVRTNTHRARCFRGHSEHVARIMFAKNGQYMFSLGGND
jgi:microtubule-associated protein-like 1/2